jgi:unsaturated rhamnogalacturonyl hydrolase
MKKCLPLLAALLLTTSLAHAADAPQPILPLLEKCADAQLDLMAGKTPIDWTAATFEIALARLSHVSSNPKYQAAEEHIADTRKWAVNAGRNRRFFADDQAVGQMYIDLAVTKGDLKLLDPLISEETAMLSQFEDFKPQVQNGNWDNDKNAQKMEVIPWWWCDALFMNPALLVRLSVVTGDNKFIDAMDKQYDVTTKLLYDPEEHLYYRDNRFPPMRTKNGKKVFWSRGDGWVMAGLANMLTYMPDNYPAREKYVARFKAMADKLLTLQNPDGLWSPSLLDPEDPAYEETSGSAFFVYAFAWGVNHHLLDQAKFQPAIDKGWAALVNHLRPDGQLGFVQPVGYQPEKGTPINADNTQYYGNGAFILAGTEVMKLHP